jgi:hypothetical protein
MMETTSVRIDEAIARVFVIHGLEPLPSDHDGTGGLAKQGLSCFDLS